MIKKFFDNNNCGEMNLWFVHGRLNLSNKTILAMQKTKASATDIVIELEKVENKSLKKTG
jgi:hypothetical protein